MPLENQNRAPIAQQAQTSALPVSLGLIDTVATESRALVAGEGLRMPSRHLDYTEVESSLVSQLSEYLRESGQHGYIVGISGGVDSAVTSTLCAKTGAPVYVVEMPIHQRSEEVNRARQHIEWLSANYPNVVALETDLTNVFDLMKSTIEGVNENVDTYMSLVNTRSRLRMTMLYAIGNARGLLVAGTGNRVEDYGVGFFTKYGDGGVDVSPIGELYKSEVRALGRAMGVESALTEAVATDGLHTNGATDEDQIGASYEELEWAMVEYDNFTDMLASNYTDIHENPESIKNLIHRYTGRARQVMEIYIKRHLANAHKMKMPPILRVPV